MSDEAESSSVARRRQAKWKAMHKWLEKTAPTDEMLDALGRELGMFPVRRDLPVYDESKPYG